MYCDCCHRVSVFHESFYNCLKKESFNIDLKQSDLLSSNIVISILFNRDDVPPDD